MNIIERFDRSFEYIGSIQTALFALQYLWLWLFAQPDDTYKVYSLAILMGFEFIMVHSGAVMAAVPKKYSILIFFPLYGLFAWGFQNLLPENDHTILILYLTTTLNRMRFAFFNTNELIKGKAVMISVMAAVCFLFSAFFVVLGDSIIPHFSLGESFYESEAYISIRQPGGLFTEKPYTAICMGVIYYSLLTLGSYKIIRSKTLNAILNKAEKKNKKK